MKINRNNYEIFFLDYLEGKLNAAEVAELLLFVDNHPDLQQELEMMGGEVPELPKSGEAEFEGKLTLKKSESGEIGRIDELFAKKLEGDLTEREAEELGREMQNNPALTKEWELFSLTKVAAENSLSFEKKSSLRQLELSETDIKLAAAVEGDLSEEHFSELKSKLEEEGRHRELTLIKSTKLAADKSVRYFNKAELKKRVPVSLVYWRSAMAVAAVALLAFLLSPLLFNNPVSTRPLADRSGTSSIERNVQIGFEKPGEIREVGTSDNSKSTVSDQIQHHRTQLADVSDQNDVAVAEDNSLSDVNREKLQKIQRQKLKLTDASFASADLAMPSEDQFTEKTNSAKSENKSEQFMSLASLATKKAEEVSGVNLNSGNLKGELMQRAVSLINDQSNELVKIDVGDDADADTVKGWKFKIGKVEVSRKKAM